MIKIIIYRILALVYILMAAVCVLFVIKPGASFFHYKKTIDNQSIKPDAGFAYRYSIEINPRLFRIQDIRLFEDGNQLTHTDDHAVIETGNGAYSVSETPNHANYIYFSASDNSNPITNGRKYFLYIPLSFITRPLGVIYLLILSPAIVWFLYIVLLIPANRKKLSQTPTGVLILLDSYIDQIFHLIASDTMPVRLYLKSRAVHWRQLVSFTILATFLYTFMEWLFFVTKPSFMSIMGFFEKVEILLISGLFFSVMFLFLLAVYIALDLIAIITRSSKVTRSLGALIPTFILSALALLLIDNFTYTILKFGISTSTGIWRGVYALIFYVLSFVIYLRVSKYLSPDGDGKINNKSVNRLAYATAGILFISAGLALIRFDVRGSFLTPGNTATNQAISRPNILLIGSDGVDAEHMSVYGYGRDTTPRLRELAQSSLVAENAFTNSRNTAGSIISLMTGKLPTQTRVLVTSEILTGLNTFQHLPGILKSEGYRAIEFGVPNYVDAYTYNMQNAFDVVNGRSEQEAFLGSIIHKLGYDNVAYFLDSLTERISNRILHIFLIRDMHNPYTLVTQNIDRLSDQSKIDQVLSLVDQSTEPLFIHIHLMTTHGGKFSPTLRVFSKGEEQAQPWMDDFYDDSILSFDHYIGELFDHLKQNGQFENTVLIIYSDHDLKWQVNERIPLIIHFPEEYSSGRIIENVQNLDIAPTVLDYLGLPIPDWMSGESLLRNNLSSHRLIFSFGTIDPIVNDDNTPSTVSEPGQSFSYPIGRFSIIDCQKWYSYDLSTNIWSSGEVSAYISPCSEDSLLKFADIQQSLAQRLITDGLGVDSLPQTMFGEP